MTTTLTVDDNLIEEARKVSPHESTEEVMAEALKEYIQFRKQLQILKAFGKIDYDESYNYKEQRKQP